ncbi:hypothetical protein OROMI_033763 [Orobanche minor]
MHGNPDNKPPSRNEMFLKTRKRDEKAQTSLLMILKLLIFL